jgi:UDP-3-O-[3-hydroxymyristoyl] glucosamine N-acyltransferase LpxD
LLFCGDSMCTDSGVLGGPMASVSSDKIASFLGVSSVGPAIDVIGPGDVGSICDQTIVFVNRVDQATIESLNRARVMAIMPSSFDGLLECAHVLVDNPRLAFAQVVTSFFIEKQKSSICETAQLGKNIQLGKNVSIGSFSVIGDDVMIGDRVCIGHHVVIQKCAIGSDSRVRSHTVIGEEGFGFERDKAGIPIRMPHIGTVEIGVHVEIGALNTIARGTLGVTRIADYVKTDDHVHIAHNVVVGKGSLITACAELSGGVCLGDRVWIGPNSAVIQKIHIGADATVGIGAVVRKDVPEGGTVAGNPGKLLR